MCIKSIYILLIVYIVLSMASFKTPKIVQTLMESKMALYILVALSIMNIMGYMMNDCSTSVVLFFLVGAVAYGFTHNMAMVLLTSLVVTTIFVACGSSSGPVAHNHHRYSMEGMEDMSGSQDDSESSKDDSEESAKTETDLATGDDAAAKKEPSGAAPSPAAAPAKTCAKGQEMNKAGECVESMTTVYKKNNRIDAAATVEDAYDDLNKILGGEGMKNLTKDTQTLVSQQKDLTEAMKSMGPLVEQASSMMNQMGGKNGIGSMLKNLTNAAPVSNSD